VNGVHGEGGIEGAVVEETRREEGGGRVTKPGRATRGLALAAIKSGWRRTWAAGPANHACARTASVGPMVIRP
jgi:hypothetical protein